MGLNFSSPTSLPDKEPLRVGDVEENHQEQIAFTTRTRSRQRIARRLEEEIDLQQADLIFLLCNFVSGLCDSSAYKSWKCFVSMQTGRCPFCLSIFLPALLFFNQKQMRISQSMEMSILMLKSLQEILSFSVLGRLKNWMKIHTADSALSSPFSSSSSAVSYSPWVGWSGPESATRWLAPFAPRASSSRWLQHYWKPMSSQIRSNQGQLRRRETTWDLFPYLWSPFNQQARLRVLGYFLLMRFQPSFWPVYIMTLLLIRGCWIQSPATASGIDGSLPSSACWEGLLPEAGYARALGVYQPHYGLLPHSSCVSLLHGGSGKNAQSWRICIDFWWRDCALTKWFVQNRLLGQLSRRI